jgi:uncharacterized protein YozE (UPF0346 family)
MRQKRILPNHHTPSIAFVVDGETEVWYLQMLQRNERGLNIKLKPEIPSKKSLKEQYELVVKQLESEYDFVVWLIDLDKVMEETRDTPKGKITPLEELKNYRKQLLKNYDNVAVIINNPCLEYWFLLHFKETAKLFTSCSNVETELKSHLADYAKTQKYFTKEGNDIYKKLKPYLARAIHNSKSLGVFSEDEPQMALCEMHSLFSLLPLKEYFKFK